MATNYEGTFRRKNLTKLKQKSNFPKHKYDDNSDLWTGQQMFGMVMPKISFNKGDVDIKNGVVKSGIFDKSLWLRWWINSYYRETI